MLARGGRTLIGMVHLGALPGQEGFAGLDGVLGRARDDLAALEGAGLDAVLVENWADRSPGPFVDPDSAAALTAVTRALVEAASVPVGVNVLPNDYRTAFGLVAEAGAAFVQLDVLVDPVVTDYAYSDAPPFEVRVDLGDLRGWRTRLGCGKVPLLASAHPKHYRLLEPGPFEDSVRAAQAAGADAVVVTGRATGEPATAERLLEARRASDLPVLLGSGLDPENAADLLAACDGAIVGTALKTPDFARVDSDRARALVLAARRGP